MLAPAKKGCPLLLAAAKALEIWVGIYYRLLVLGFDALLLALGGEVLEDYAILFP
jgi:hypothetical protein